MTGFINEPAAIVSGPAAYLLSRLLRAAPVVAYIRGARWLHGDDFTQALRAIHAAGHAWETSIDVHRPPAHQTAGHHGNPGRRVPPRCHR